MKERGIILEKVLRGKAGKERTLLNVKIKPELEVQGSRNPDLQFKSKAVKGHGNSCRVKVLTSS